jgi:hypothetical protein
METIKQTRKPTRSQGPRCVKTFTVSPRPLKCSKVFGGSHHEIRTLPEGSFLAGPKIMRRDGGLSAIRKSFVMHQANPAETMTCLIDTPLSPGLGVHVPRGPHTSKHSSWLPALVDVFALGSERKRQAHIQSALESRKRRPAGRPPGLCASRPGRA